MAVSSVNRWVVSSSKYRMDDFCSSTVDEIWRLKQQQWYSNPNRGPQPVYPSQHQPHWGAGQEKQSESLFPPSASLSFSYWPVTYKAISHMSLLKVSDWLSLCPLRSGNRTDTTWPQQGLSPISWRASWSRGHRWVSRRASVLPSGSERVVLQQDK